MRRILAVGLSAGVLLVWWFCQDLSVKAQGGQAAAIQNGDVNGDDKRDIADAVFLLTWMFEGGPEPVPLACADPVDLEARVSALEEWRASQEFGRAIAGIYFAIIDAPFLDAPVKGFLTFTADGGLILSSQFQFHLIDGFRSVMQGTWNRTGENQITGDVYWLPFGADGAPGGMDDNDVSKHRWVWTFPNGFNDLAGQTVAGCAWTPELDPLQDAPIGGPPAFTMTGRRIDLETPNCQ